MCLVLFVMVRLAGANAFGSNRLQRYAYFSEWQYVDPKKILFVALTLVKQSPLPLLGILPWSYLQSLSLSQVHRQAHQKQYHDNILLLFHPSIHRYGSNQSLHLKQYIYIYLTLKLEAIHLHDKSRHSEVFAIDFLDNLGGIHLRDAPTIDNVYRRCMKEKLPCKS